MVDELIKEIKCLGMPTNRSQERLNSLISKIGYENLKNQSLVIFIQDLQLYVKQHENYFYQNESLLMKLTGRLDYLYIRLEKEGDFLYEKDIKDLKRLNDWLRDLQLKRRETEKIRRIKEQKRERNRVMFISLFIFWSMIALVSIGIIGLDFRVLLISTAITFLVFIMRSSSSRRGNSTAYQDPFESGETQISATNFYNSQNHNSTRNYDSDY